MQRAGQDRASARAPAPRRPDPAPRSRAAETDEPDHSAEHRAHDRKHPVRPREISRHRAMAGAASAAGPKAIAVRRSSSHSFMIENSRESSVRRQRESHAVRHLDDIRAFCRDLPDGDARAAAAATLRQQALTKPPGSLGRLEELAVWLARWQAANCRDSSASRRGLRRQSRRRRARRLGLSAGGHGADGGEFCRAAARRSTRSPRWPAPISGRAARARPPDRRFHRRSRRWTTKSFLPPSRPATAPVPPECDLLASARWASATPRRRRCCARRCSAAAPGAGSAAAPASTMPGSRASARRSRPRSAVTRHARRSAQVAAPLGGRELAAIAGAMLAARTIAFPCCSTASSRPRPCVAADAAHAGVTRSLRRGACLGRSRSCAPARRLGLEAAARSRHAPGRGLRRRRRHPAAARGRRLHAGMATFDEAGVSGGTNDGTLTDEN